MVDAPWIRLVIENMLIIEIDFQGGEKAFENIESINKNK